jgi:hypothetical protein
MFACVYAQVPFIIRRRLPNGSFEDWAVSELIIEHVTLQVCVCVCARVDIQGQTRKRTHTRAHARTCARAHTHT